MEDIVVAPELWSTSLLPEGILERWRLPSGSQIAAGQAVAEVRIGENLHEIASPAAGALITFAHVNDVVEPGAVIGCVAYTS